MKKIISIIIIALTLISCNSRQAQEKEADKRLKHIEQLIALNAYNGAKIEIDSIHLLYPKLIDKRKIAAALKDTIVRRESSRTLAYCDSIMPIKQHEADSIQKNFRFEKNEKYQEFGNYVYKTQITENNFNRNYLKAYVDENCDFYLISNYTGKKIEQHSIEVNCGELSAHSDTVKVSTAALYSFDDGGSHWETLTLKNEENNGIASFILQNGKFKIKVTLFGSNKKKYTYFLADTDKKAIAETYHLWIVKKDLNQLQKEIKKAQLRIARINKNK